MKLPQRKHIRLDNYDYSQPGAYFITICVDKRKALLSNMSVGASIARPKEIHLTKYGTIVEKSIKNIPIHYPVITVDNYVNNARPYSFVIANTFRFLRVTNGRLHNKKVIQQTKGVITKQIGFSIWQKSFNDHIVRGRSDYQEIWQYIENNPYK